MENGLTPAYTQNAGPAVYTPWGIRYQLNASTFVSHDAVKCSSRLGLLHGARGAQNVGLLATNALRSDWCGHGGHTQRAVGHGGESSG